MTRGAGLWGVSGNPDVAGGSNGLSGLPGNPATRLPGYTAPGILPAYIDPVTGGISTTPPDMSRQLPGGGTPLAPATAPVAVIDRASEADQRLGALPYSGGGIDPGAQTGGFLVDDKRNPRAPLPRQGNAFSPGDPGGHVPWDFNGGILPAYPPADASAALALSLPGSPRCWSTSGSQALNMPIRGPACISGSHS